MRASRSTATVLASPLLVYVAAWAVRTVLPSVVSMYGRHGPSAAHDRLHPTGHLEWLSSRGAGPLRRLPPSGGASPRRRSRRHDVRGRLRRVARRGDRLPGQQVISQLVTCRDDRRVAPAHRPTVDGSRRPMSVYYGSMNAWGDGRHPERMEDMNVRIELPILGILGEQDQGVAIDDVRQVCDLLESMDKNCDITAHKDPPRGFIDNPMPGRYRKGIGGGRVREDDRVLQPGAWPFTTAAARGGLEHVVGGSRRLRRHEERPVRVVEFAMPSSQGSAVYSQPARRAASTRSVGWTAQRPCERAPRLVTAGKRWA